MVCFLSLPSKQIPGHAARSNNIYVRRGEDIKTAMQLAILLSLSQMTCEYCKKNCKTANQQSFVNKSNEYSTLWRTTNPFIPLLSFLFVLQRLVSETFQVKRIQCFVAPDRSKIISLQDIPRVVTVTVRDRKILPLPELLIL